MIYVLSYFIMHCYGKTMRYYRSAAICIWEPNNLHSASVLLSMKGWRVGEPQDSLETKKQV